MIDLSDHYVGKLICIIFIGVIFLILLYLTDAHFSNINIFKYIVNRKYALYVNDNRTKDQNKFISQEHYREYIRSVRYLANIFLKKQFVNNTYVRINDTIVRQYDNSKYKDIWIDDLWTDHIFLQIGEFNKDLLDNLVNTTEECQYHNYYLVIEFAKKVKELRKAKI